MVMEIGLIGLPPYGHAKTGWWERGYSYNQTIVGYMAESFWVHVRTKCVSMFFISAWEVSPLLWEIWNSIPCSALVVQTVRTVSQTHHWGLLSSSPVALDVATTILFAARFCVATIWGRLLLESGVYFFGKLNDGGNGSHYIHPCWS